MPFDPSSAQVVQSSAFDPSSASPIDQSSEYGGVTGAINAIGGGAQQTLANSVGYAGGLVKDAINASGLAPQAVGNAIGTGTQALSNALQPPGFVQQAQQQNPTLSKVGNVVGGAMAMGATGAGAAALASKGVITAESAPYLANMAIGAATAGPGITNRAVGAASGAAITGVAQKVSEGLSSIGKSTPIQDAMKNLVSNVNSVFKGQTSDQAAMQSVKNMWNMASTTRDALYTDFKNTPGVVNFNSLSKIAQSNSSDLEDVMTPGQKGAFATIQRQAAAVKNLDDANELNKSIAQMRPLFYKSGTAPDVTDAFKGLQKTSSDLMTSNAEALGAGDKLAAAKKFNTDVIAPLQDFGADKIAQGGVSSDGFLAKYIKNPNGMNPNGTPEKLGNLLNAMDENGKQIVTNNFIQRAIKVSQVGTDGVDPGKGSALLGNYLQTYGKYLGTDGQARLAGAQKILSQSESIQSKAMGAVVGAVQKSTVIGSTMRALELIKNVAGQKVLEFIGNHPQGIALAKALATVSTSTASMMAGKAAGMVNLGNTGSSIPQNNQGQLPGGQ